MNSLKKVDHRFIIISVLLIVLINFLTFIADKLFDIQSIHSFSLHNFITFPLLWGISIFLSLRFFKKLPIFLRQPMIRIILWSPIVFLDVIDDRSEYTESPSYILYLFNKGLLPISELFLQPLNHMINFQDRLFYINLVLWLGFAAILAMILFCAERISKIKKVANKTYSISPLPDASL